MPPRASGGSSRANGPGAKREKVPFTCHRDRTAGVMGGGGQRSEERLPQQSGRGHGGLSEVLGGSTWIPLQRWGSQGCRQVSVCRAGHRTRAFHGARATRPNALSPSPWECAPLQKPHLPGRRPCAAGKLTLRGCQGGPGVSRGSAQPRAVGEVGRGRGAGPTVRPLLPGLPRWLRPGSHGHALSQG